MLFCVSFFSTSHPQMERNPVRLRVLFVLKMCLLSIGFFIYHIPDVGKMVFLSVF